MARDEKVVLLLNTVENEGLDYAVTKWGNWARLEETQPELYALIKSYQDAAKRLEDAMEEIEHEYGENGWW